MESNFSGRLLKSRREQTPDPATGRPYTLGRIAELVGVGKTTVAGWESGEIATLKAEHANRLSEILPITVTEILADRGYRLEQEPLTPEERELLALFRRAEPVGRRGALAVLRESADYRAESRQARGLPMPQPANPTGQGRR